MPVRLVVLAHKWDEFEEQCAAARNFLRRNSAARNSAQFF